MTRPRHAARVLIFGGSQGAHAINVAMVEAASRLAATGLALAITHQTGERDLDLVRAAYQRAGLAARVEAFIFEIDGEMKAADLVICRAGATTLAELTAAGRPAILVPLPTATDDHQRKNAEVIAPRRGGDWSIDERELSGRATGRAILRRWSPTAGARAGWPRPRDSWRGPTRRSGSPTGWSMLGGRRAG